MGFKRKLSIFIFLFSFLCLAASAQVRNWDDVTKKELQMEYYSPDSSASAVVLFDRAEVDLNQNLEYVMERHIRIKILTEKGYKWAEAAITYNEELDQEVNRIRGHTFTLNSKGNIKKHKLDGDSIFEEDLLRGYRQIKFTMPALEPGAVFEYKYRKEIGSPYLLPDWEFQRSIPVVWSEYQVKIPDWFFYNKMFKGTHPLHIQEKELYQDRMRFIVKQQAGSFRASTYNRSAYIDVNGSINRWVMKDLPAVKKLPYMTSVDDYKSKLWMQLTEIRIPNQSPRYFLKSWDDVAEELMDLETFGERLRSRSDFQKQVEKLTEGINDPHAKVEAVFNYLNKSMVWDKSYTTFAENDLEDVYKMQKGSSSELNLLLVQLLREAGLNADPVLISTRNHGKVFEHLAIVNQFNHVISCVTIDDQTYLLDLTTEYENMNPLPVSDLNGKGLAVSNASARWVRLEPLSKTKRRITFNAKIDPDGKIDGQVYTSLSGYDAANDRLKINKKGKEEYIEDLFHQHFNTGVVDSFQIADKRSKSGGLSYSMYIRDAKPFDQQVSGELLYLVPLVFLRETDNPFPQPERKIPIDFPYLFEKEYVANFVVPEGYEIVELPESTITSIPGGAMEIRRLAQVTGNRITIMSKLSVKRTTYKPEEYKFIKGFYSYAVKLHSEPIVLKTKNDTAK